MSDIGFIIEFEFDIIGRGYGIEVSGRMRGVQYAALQSTPRMAGVSTEQPRLRYLS